MAPSVSRPPNAMKPVRQGPLLAIADVGEDYG